MAHTHSSPTPNNSSSCDPCASTGAEPVIHNVYITPKFPVFGKIPTHIVPNHVGLLLLPWGHEERSVSPSHYRGCSDGANQFGPGPYSWVGVGSRGVVGKVRLGGSSWSTGGWLTDGQRGGHSQSGLGEEERLVGMAEGCWTLAQSGDCLSVQALGHSSLLSPGSYP
ncbi:unnamed protein product [Leuciscus chuanchicus]